MKRILSQFSTTARPTPYERAYFTIHGTIADMRLFAERMLAALPEKQDPKPLDYDLSDDECHGEKVYGDNHAALEAETDIEPSAKRRG